MNEPHNPLQTIFAEALEIADAAQREAFVAQACGANQALRREVEELLQANAVTGPFLPEQPAAAGAQLGFARVAGILRAEGTRSCSEPRAEKPGDLIGRYTLLQQIGEGGMGVVYMAEQEEPVRRRVALKVIKLGMDTRSVIARFEAERQALALMDHPNIAKVLDAGATETGRPFFVMELVRGIKITEHCDQNHLSTQQRLHLFTQICQAIQHAHQKGIIHRDIKPSNIMVADYDGAPVPKVIDFGVAKATAGQTLTDKTLFTAFEQFIGTPAYMSPEQAKLSGLDIDTRSDIYSLGVLLYELLTGKPPFDAKRLVEAGLEEICRIIREEEPPRPSTRLSTLDGEERTTVARQRQCEPPKLAGLIRGDLDWIVMKTLEKDRNRRYETANGLAMDLQRFLNQEPIVARPPSSLYRCQKLIRRHKLAFASVASVTTALLAGIGVSTWEAIRATHAERDQIRLRQDAESARRSEEKQRERTEREALVTRQNLYAADVSLAQRAWDEGNLGRARELLEAHRPKPGQADLRGFEWRYFWSLCQGEQLLTFRGHSNVVTCVAFSPDGKTLASGSQDGTVKLWDVISKTLVATWAADSNGVASLNFSPSGDILGVGTESDGVKLWHLRTREVTATFEGESARISFSPVDRLLAVGSGGSIYGSSGGVVTLWDYGTGKRLLNLSESGSQATFSPDGQILATANWKGAIKLWQVNTGQQIRTLAGAGEVLTIIFDPGGHTLASGNWKGLVQFWDVSTGDRLGDVQAHAAQATAIAFAPDGATFVTAGGDHALRIWSVADRKEQATFRGHANEVWAMALSPVGNLLATGSKDETVMLWRAEAKKETDILPSVVSPVAPNLAITIARPVFSPDSKSLATGSEGDEVKIWDVATKQSKVAFKGERIPLAFSADGRTLMTINPSNRLRIWDVATATNRATVCLSQKPFPTFAAILSPDARFLVTSDSNGQAALWDAHTGVMMALLRGHRYCIRGRAFTPDSQTLVTTSDDALIHLWNAVDGKKLMKLSGHKRNIVGVGFSPDGQTFATAGYDDTVKLWDRLTGRLQATLTGHAGGAYAVAFSPEGKTLAAASGNGDVKLWNLATLREVAYLRDPKSVTFMVFSPDGQTLATVDEDRLVHLWSAPFLAGEGPRFPRR